jgi:hypothetical protein
VNAPMWAYDAASMANIRSGSNQTKAIHAALLWVGTHPDRASTLLEKQKNESDKTANAGETGGGDDGPLSDL